jgi:6-pyruvoyltetrahydropterin/6-carboxytetrahydropterin synthase
VYVLKVRSSFDAAHSITGHPGPCARLHGHRYDVEAEFGGGALDSLGMVRDFDALKKALSEVLPDHQNLNDVMDCVTTVENISRWLYDRLLAQGLPVLAVTVWETETCGCRYTPE